uniref:Uncharacterized protein n=1 Tax=Panagrolaimus sp. JU765 TaxID=591449 RepID=A0AC34PZX8_9BILA
MEDAATNTDPPKVTTIGDTSHELKIFKTKKPIKECKDERALTSKKSTKESPTKNFFRKMGFGTKSASVSPTKELGKVKTRRASEQRLNSTKITKPLPKIDAEKSKKDAEPKIETKKVEEATEM